MAAGLCSEFGSLSWLAKSHEAALRGIRKLVTEVVEDLLESGEPVPEPFSTRRYSGKFQVRIPPEEHRSLAREAAEQGVSLNRLVSLRLAKSTRAIGG
ncbi:MAG: toxin-antitoxin system HicB family antitoxin [Planctomycetota bacterium]